MIKIGQPIRNLAQVQYFLKRLPRGTIRVALKAFAEYLIGDSGHGLRHEPGYRYVSRAKAYGDTFVSDKQRKWFWANGGPDMIGNNRTGQTSAGYGYQETRGGYGINITNSTPGAYYTQSDAGQAAQPALVGWRKVTANIKGNIHGALRSATAAVNQYLRSK